MIPRHRSELVRMTRRRRPSELVESMRQELDNGIEWEIMRHWYHEPWMHLAPLWDIGRDIKAHAYRHILSED